MSVCIASCLPALERLAMDTMIFIGDFRTETVLSSCQHRTGVRSAL